jgi:hypothetical protein
MFEHTFRRAIFIAGLSFANVIAYAAPPPPLHGLQEVGQERVELRDGFWGPTAFGALKGSVNENVIFRTVLAISLCAA